MEKEKNFLQKSKILTPEKLHNKMIMTDSKELKLTLHLLIAAM